MSTSKSGILRQKEAVLEQYKRKIDLEEYHIIREEYKIHSIAEDNRDINGLMSTLTEDCEYILVQTGQSWKGKVGATRFYMELLTAFPDIDFQLQNFVCGPQGVYEEAHVTATHKGTWLGLAPTDKNLEWDVAIFFPWDPEKKKFSGERIFTTLDARELDK